MSRLPPQAFDAELTRLIHEGEALDGRDERQRDIWREDCLATLGMAPSSLDTLISEFNSAGQGTLRGVPYLPGGLTFPMDYSEEIEDKVRVLKKIRRLVPSVQSSAPAKRGTARTAPSVNVSPSFHVGGGHATAEASSSVSVVVDWSPAFAAAEALPGPNREDAMQLLREIRDALEGRAPTEGVRERIGRLYDKGKDFFLQVLPVLFQYADRIGPLLSGFPK